MLMLWKQLHQRRKGFDGCVLHLHTSMARCTASSESAIPRSR
jgi:hypothetical protein